MDIGVPRGRHALSVSIVFSTLSTIFTGIRIYTRAFLVKQMGADDWTILVALAFSWAFFALFVGEVKNLMGEHFNKIPPDVYVKQMICFWASVPIYQGCLLTTKASILLQYKRVFSTKRMRIACYCLIIFLACYGTWTFVSAWLNCVPVSKFWEPTKPGFCLSKKGLWFSNSAIHIFTDILILLYPMPVLKNLQLPKRQKIALMAVFALGAFVLITSVLRLKSLLVISDSSDPTYDNPGAATWSSVECNVAIICACMPGMRAFISRLLPRFLSTYRSNAYNTATKSKGTFGQKGSHGTNNNLTNVQASVVAAEPDYHMQDFSGRADSPDSREWSAGGSVSSGGKGQGQKGDIKVTTILSQEFTSSTPPDDGSKDDNSSVKRLV